MKNVAFAILLPLIFTVLFSGCEKEDACEDGSPCNGETVKEIKNNTGIVNYDDTRKEFLIIFTPEGTIDTQYVTFPCSLKDEFKQDGIKVNVTGSFKPVCEPIIAVFGGQEFYHLKISDISIVEEY